MKDSQFFDRRGILIVDFTEFRAVLEKSFFFNPGFCGRSAPVGRNKSDWYAVEFLIQFVGKEIGDRTKLQNRFGAAGGPANSDVFLWFQREHLGDIAKPDVGLVSFFDRCLEMFEAEASHSPLHIGLA